MRFDPKTFETLNGLDASTYAVDLTKNGISDKDSIVTYFKERVPTMDPPHLEVAIYLLAKVDTEASWHLVTEHLDHSDFRIRFVATKMIKDIPLVDEVLMRRIINIMSTPAGAGFIGELKGLLNRPADAESKRLAQAFLLGQKSHNE